MSTNIPDAFQVEIRHFEIYLILMLTFFAVDSPNSGLYPSGRREGRRRELLQSKNLKSF